MQARQQKDLMLYCGPCEDISKSFNANTQEKFESTLRVESILMKPFVNVFHRTHLRGQCRFRLLLAYWDAMI